MVILGENLFRPSVATCGLVCFNSISNCGQPTIKTCGGGQMTRKVGYYAGWAARRKCSAFRPKDIDLEGFTDVIFSFALITQDLGLGQYHPILSTN